MIYMQCCLVRSGHGTCDIAAAHIGPRLGITIYRLMPPPDHDMGSKQIRIGQMLGPDKVAQILATCRNWNDQADMDAVGFHKNRNAISWLGPAGIGRYETACEG